MTISSLGSMSPVEGASGIQPRQPAAAPAKASAPQDTVQLSQAAKAAVSGDADHDGDSH